MKTGKLQLVGILVLLAYAANSYACDENSAQLVAKTYALANPLMGRENEIISVIQANRAYFNPSGGAIRCMQRLGTVLVNNGLSQFSQGNRHRAAEKFAGDMPPGLEHLPGEVDRSMNSYAYDLFTMGQELHWLAGVLPSVAQSNFAPYNNTGTQTRQMLRQTLGIYQLLCQMDPYVCELMSNIFSQLTPAVEQQVYTLARQVGN